MLSPTWFGNRSMRSHSRRPRIGRRSQYNLRAVIEPAEPRLLLSGTSYALNPIYAFTGGSDGANPYTGLIADSAGNLYGTTNGDTAVVYEIPAGTSTPTTLYTFNFGGGNGLPSVSPLIDDGSGHLFGTTNSGGANDDGSVFEIDLNQSPAAYTELAAFDTSAEGGNQGDNPQGTLALVGGILYGATRSGGANDDGTIFSIDPNAGTPTITTLASFDDTNNGFWPNTGVVAANGNLYGAAEYNPTNSNGEIYAYNITGNSLSVVYSFADETAGEGPGPLIADSSGNIYGTTSDGSDDGYIYKIDAGTTNLSVLASLSGDNNTAAYPQGALTIDSQGNLFGTTNGGGTTGDGAIFEVDHTSHAVTTIASFDSATTGDNYTSGGTLLGGMALVNGNFFGTTHEGAGSNNDGAVFELKVAGPPTKLVFATQPTSQIANNSLNGDITVDVEDANGNIMQTDNSTVTLSVATPNGSTFGTGSTVTAQAVNGVATFDFLILNKAGTYTLSATDTDSGTVLTPAASNSFTISHASAYQLAFAVQPTSTGENTSISPAVVVNVEDAYGNIVTNDASAVTLSVNSGPSTAINGNVIAANQGVATFSALSLPNAGNYTLSATDGGLTGAISNPFTITGPFGAASQLVFSSQPVNTTAGSTISDANGHAITVQVEDANGNVVVTDTSHVSITLSGGTALDGTLSEPVVNGIATFPDLSTLIAGTYTLTVADGSLAGATSNSFLVSAAAVSQVGLINPPTTSSTGGPTTLTAGAQDQYGNIVTGYATPITVTANGPSGTTAQSFTLTPTNGQATFTINLTNPGSYSFNVNSGAFTQTTVSPITLTYVQPTLVFASPIGAVTAGQKMSNITLTLYNESGVITDQKPKVTLGVLTGPGNKVYGKTKSVGKNGQVTFKGLSIRQANPNAPYTLEASANGFGTGTSNSFLVVAAPAKKMAFTAQPSGVTHGMPFNVGVQLVDKYGNIATNNASTVTLTLGSHPKNSTLNGVLSETPINGLAEFYGLILSDAGKYTLKATDNAKGVGKASTKKFTVT